MSYSSLENKPI